MSTQRVIVNTLIRHPLSTSCSFALGFSPFTMQQSLIESSLVLFTSTTSSLRLWIAYLYTGHDLPSTPENFPAFPAFSLALVSIRPVPVLSTTGLPEPPMPPAPPDICVG